MVSHMQRPKKGISLSIQRYHKHISFCGLNLLQVIISLMIEVEIMMKPEKGRENNIKSNKYQNEPLLSFR